MKRTNEMKSLTTALEGLSLFIAEPRAWGVREFAERAGIAPSNAHRILASLKQAGYLEQKPAGKTYSLGIRALELGEAYRRSVNLNLELQAILDEAALSTGETVYLNFLDGTDVVCTQKASGSAGLQLQIVVGERSSLFRGSRGRAILAFLPETQREHLIADYLQQQEVPQALRDLVAPEELLRIRTRGYCFSVGERLNGVAGVSTPVRKDGAVTASITIGGASERFDEATVSDHVATAKKLAAQLERHLNHA
ncbi:IclR family transcriptional regulator [Paenarthrobacter nicotinovorans]|uniref:IclR family transcriptional regulator n=1 Tax=Paenarthrobacter nicotinovorans TaxID=29320 RepID=UPI00381B8C38